MSELPTLKDTIIDMLKRDSVPCMETGPLSSDKEEKTTPADRAYLASWLEHAENPIWSKILASAQRLDRRRSYTWLVWLVLRVRRLAESVRSGADPMLEFRQKERKALLELADKAAAIADYYRQQEKQDIASWYAEFLRPVPELLRLHEKQAKLFRQLAGEEPKPTVPPLRQDRRKGRVGLRQRRAFITLMFRELYYRAWPRSISPMWTLLLPSLASRFSRSTRKSSAGPLSRPPKRGVARSGRFLRKSLRRVRSIKPTCHPLKGVRARSVR
jgi:hypothetical protein